MWRASFERGVGDRRPASACRAARLLPRAGPSRQRGSLALAGSKLVGFVAANPESVVQLYVRVGCQRQGIGTRMLDWAKSRSTGSLWLYTFAQNLVACAFYERNGFRGRRARLRAELGSRRRPLRVAR
jgi:ribosomal protein S18 acetylase RimI-like enzyme